MDLISTVYVQRNESKQANIPIPARWFQESVAKCDVSTRNVLAFVSASLLNPSCWTPNDDDDHPLPLPNQYKGKMGMDKIAKEKAQFLAAGNFVYVCDLNTPWEVNLVTQTQHEVSTLKWDGSKGQNLILADKSGQVEVWQTKNNLLSEWECVHKNSFPGEVFLTAFFIPDGRKTYTNVDNMDASQYHEKFVFRPLSAVAQEFAQREMLGILLVSHTGLVLCLAIPRGSGSQVLEVKTATKCLGVTRNRVRTVDITFVNDGSLLIAASNGDPTDPIRFNKVLLSLNDCAYDDGIQLCMKVETFPGLCTRAVATDEKSEDQCLAIVDLCFVNGDDTDSIVVATKHPAGGRLELWELKEFQQNINKIFLSGGGGPNESFSLPAWHYVEQFSGPVSQIVSVATPKRSFQTGRAAACYVTVAYTDGSIQCLIRDNLQQIGSVDLPKAGNLSEELQPSSKMSKASVTICDMSFTATGNVLVTLDSLGQLYLYRMSPISDPGGPHVPATLQTMFEFSLTSALDWWDVTICLKPAHVEAVCLRLNEEFEKQSKPMQEYYHTRYMSLKSCLHRLVSSPSLEYKAADCYAQLMLHSIYGVLKSLLGPSDLMHAALTAVEKVSNLLENQKANEADVDGLVKVTQSIHTEFAVEQSVLQSHQHLIQWVTNLSLHILASVPSYRERNGPGSDLVMDKNNLRMLRELLFIIRLWGRTNEGILPSYTKTTESFDVLAKLFSLLTRLKEGCNDAIIDECILLPSQVMIPPLDITIPSRGLAHMLISSNRGPISAFYNQEPDLDANGSAVNSGGSKEKFDPSPLIEGVMIPTQFMDCVRHIYLGKKPYVIRECPRCTATSLPPPSTDSSKNALNKGWDHRWGAKCPCGGPWKIRCMDEQLQINRN